VKRLGVKNLGFVFIIAGNTIGNFVNESNQVFN
jgi:hypothetical protein